MSTFVLIYSSTKDGTFQNEFSKYNLTKFRKSGLKNFGKLNISIMENSENYAIYIPTKKKSSTFSKSLGRSVICVKHVLKQVSTSFNKFSFEKN